MKVSAFDFNHARALHHLLEEAHVGRAAAHLSITPAAASNALRRLREEMQDPLLVRQGRGLVRTRMGEALRPAAREVVAAVERLLEAARPFDPTTFSGDLPIALSEHVAALLLPHLEGLVRERAPAATLAIASIPADAGAWLERTRGVLVGPMGPDAATHTPDRLRADDFYEDRYICVMRRGHPVPPRHWDAARYAAQGHVLVTPRGRTALSDVDEQLGQRGLVRRVARIVPSFTLALPLVQSSDLITTMPERCARGLDPTGLQLREVPLPLRPVAMKLVRHPAHAADARGGFIKALLEGALAAAGRPPPRLSPPARGRGSRASPASPAR